MNTITIHVPGAWDDDEAIGARAGDGEAAYIELERAFYDCERKRHGRGEVLILKLSKEGFAALFEEAQYQNEYWNTDNYGIKEAGSYQPRRGQAAKVLWERVQAIASEMTI